MELLPRDISFLSKLNDYKYVSSSTLYAFTKATHVDEIRCLQRLKKLRDYKFLSREDEFVEEDGIRYKTRDGVYQLEPFGRAALLDNNIEPYDERPWFSAGIQHDYPTSAAVSSIELFSPSHGIEFLPPRYFAEKSRNEHPFSFKVQLGGKERDFYPDYPVFGLKYETYGIPIVGFETDNGREPLEGDIERSSVMKHILSYDQLDKNNTFQGRYKLPSKKYYVLILTMNLMRARNIVKKIEEKIGKSEIFCVGVQPKFVRFDHRTAPTDELLTMSWLRAGYNPIVLGKEK